MGNNNNGKWWKQQQTTYVIINYYCCFFWILDPLDFFMIITCFKKSSSSSILYSMMIQIKHYLLYLFAIFKQNKCLYREKMKEMFWMKHRKKIHNFQLNFTMCWMDHSILVLCFQNKNKKKPVTSGCNYIIFIHLHSILFRLFFHSLFCCSSSFVVQCQYLSFK